MNSGLRSDEENLSKEFPVPPLRDDVYDPLSWERQAEEEDFRDRNDDYSQDEYYNEFSYQEWRAGELGLTFGEDPDSPEMHWTFEHDNGDGLGGWCWREVDDGGWWEEDIGYNPYLDWDHRGWSSGDWNNNTDQ
jgi:hypothetical protein